MPYKVSAVADSRGGFTLYTSQTDDSFRSEYSAFHFDASHVSQQIVTPMLREFVLLPLESGYVLFAVGPNGPTMQFLDTQGNPIGQAIPTQVTDLIKNTFPKDPYLKGVNMFVWEDQAAEIKGGLKGITRPHPPTAAPADRRAAALRPGR